MADTDYTLLTVLEVGYGVDTRIGYVSLIVGVGVHFPFSIYGFTGAVLTSYTRHFLSVGTR